MQSKGILLATVLSAGFLYACQRDEGKTVQLLEQILAEEKQQTEALKKGGGAGGPMGQRPPQQAPSRPNPNDVFSVDITGAPADGKANAKVTVVKAFEFACPFCERARPTMDQLLKDYGDDVRVVYKHYVVHPQAATIPAHAACAAGKQGKFKQMYDAIWEKGFKANRDLSQENMEKLGKEIGLNVDKMKKDMEGECQALVRKDQEDLGKVGVNGTPAFFINGRFLSGARPVDQFKRIVDEELKKADEAIKKGEATQDNYYSKVVMEKGKKRFDPAAAN